MDSHPLQVVLSWYHAVLALGGLLAVFATAHRLWIAPIQRWRADVVQRVHAIEVEQALQAQRLASGDAKFDEVLRAIRDMRECLVQLKVELAKRGGET